MTKLLALPVGYIATVGASIKRRLDHRTSLNRAQQQAVCATFCKEYCFTGSTQRVNRCDCE